MFFSKKFYQIFPFRAMSSLIKIGTHDGTFHADEALACYLLKKLPVYKNAQIIRTRNENILKTCDIVVDVGAVYDPSNHRYDHHQNTFQVTMEQLRPCIKSSIRLSSAGLVYHHFGEDIFRSIADQPLDSDILSEMFSYVYNHFIQEIDAIDNGVPIHDGELRYNYHTHLSARVANLHPGWNAENSTCSMELFEKAMSLTGKEFEECVEKFIKSHWPARVIIQSALSNRLNVHASGEIIEFKFCPWKSHVFDMEKILDIEGKIKFAIFQDRDTWRTSAMSIGPASFILRVPLFNKWHGLRDEELQKESGIPDAFFVHANGFIGGAKSREGALALAVKTLEKNATSVTF